MFYSILERRKIEIEIASSFLQAMKRIMPEQKALEVFQEVVLDQAQKAAASRKKKNMDLLDLKNIWLELGGEGRLDLEFLHATTTELHLKVKRCSYAEHYRNHNLVEEGIRFSCERDVPFARALFKDIEVLQSKSILEGSPFCEFKYNLSAQTSSSKPNQDLKEGS